MSTPAWCHPADLMQRLIEQPQDFQFFQAVRLIERWLQGTGAANGYALERVLRFQNSVSLTFPASQIEAITVDADLPVHSAGALRDALENRRLQHIRITPAFMGLLGTNGTLPHCYTEAIAAQIHFEKNDGGRAFLDVFSQRSMMLFYRAWEKCRIEYRQGREGLLSLQLALAGTLGWRQGDDLLPDEVIAHYASLLRHRPVSAAVLVDVLKEYFGLPFELLPFSGYWVTQSPSDRTRLGVADRGLGAGAMLGPRYFRCDLRVRLCIGPLTRTEYTHFLPGALGSMALRSFLALFILPNLCFEVCLMLRPADVVGLRLGSDIGLGRGVVLTSRPAVTSCYESFYHIAF